ncbi:hypothetical protein EA796_06835 [Pseudomonas sp. AOB-7]|uniref:hypothetical protein n=1 Tax=Pseudomonas sp. AOB-7 TaxID=2482750 RepID=UPI000EFA589D|nr:hypothetical protein [Pseudomonas sp. AOB-7]RMH85219.1 hypothetical protein EA796_06835 [Pseudomonas sp. AOB-7]
MAKQAKYVVVDGCIQEGKEVFVKGQPYAPLSAEWAAALVKAGTIAAADSEAGKAAAASYKAPEQTPGAE